MRSSVVVLCILFLVGILFVFSGGCGQRPEKVETPIESQEGLAEAPTQGQEEMPKVLELAQTQLEQTEVAKEEAVPEVPTVEDIQLVLQNAGLYQGKIDGVVGPKTKKAIENFQAQNELKVDGKVGPRTWKKLKVFYTSPSQNTSSPVQD